MTKFFNNLNRKLTLGNLFTIIASFIFAIVIRHLSLHYLDFLPVKGELEPLDISYFAVVVLFKLIFSAYLEYLLDDKFSIPLFEAIGKGVGQKEVTTLSMVNSGPQGSSVENSSNSKNTVTKQLSARERNEKFIDEEFKVSEIMWDVLIEQNNKILELHKIKALNDAKFYQVEGSLDLTVPATVTDSDANKLSKQVGAIDRALQNKFAEYNNLSSRDARLYESNWTTTYKDMSDINIELYKDLFEKKK